MLGPSRQKFCKCGEPLTEYVGFAYKHGDKDNDWLCMVCEGLEPSPESEHAGSLRYNRYAPWGLTLDRELYEWFLAYIP